MSNVEDVLFLVVLFVKFRNLKIRVYDPIRSVLAPQGCEGADIPFLNLAWSNVVRPAAAVVAVIVDVQVVSVRRLLSEVRDTRDYDK